MQPVETADGCFGIILILIIIAVIIIIILIMIITIIILIIRIIITRRSTGLQLTVLKLLLCAFDLQMARLTLTGQEKMKLGFYKLLFSKGGSHVLEYLQRMLTCEKMFSNVRM